MEGAAPTRAGPVNRTRASAQQRANPVSGPVQAELWLEKPVLWKEEPWLPAL
jgi:hypothetical protein